MTTLFVLQHLRKDPDGYDSLKLIGLEAVLCELLDAVTPYEGRIAEAVARFGLEVGISFGVYLSDETPACWFSADTIRRVSQLQASLDIDLIRVE
jgi:hypothetical protein